VDDLRLAVADAHDFAERLAVAYSTTEWSNSPRVTNQCLRWRSAFIRLDVPVRPDERDFQVGLASLISGLT